MSDTVIVSLITFASGLCGAGVGAIVTLITAHKEAQRHFREEKKLCFSQFISAYHELLRKTSINDEIKQPLASTEEDEIGLFTQFQTAYSNAILICDRSSIDAFSALLYQTKEMIKTRDYSKLGPVYKKAIDAMRRELKH